MNLMAALVLFLLPWAVALVNVRHHHLDSGAVGLAATFSLGLPALWLAVAGYLEARRPEQATELTMAHVADQLAIAVGAQWNAEAAMRRLNDPYPLPVSWDPGDASLADSWALLVKLASSGAGWPAPSPAKTWASGPDDLGGKEGELVEVLARVPTGRLVVLGEPGAGKTMLMVRLVLDLLGRRTAGGPVPFLASVASWDPTSQDLRGWLGDQLMIDHPALASPPPTDRPEPTQAAALLESGLILLILDGLDEIPKKVRGAAISRINDALRPGKQMVVTCRTEHYRNAVRPEDGIEVTLRGAAAIELNPLDADTVRGYLCADAGGPAARARWDPVRMVLGTDAPAGRALTTPLMVGLARAIYNPRPDESPGKLREPAELCSPALTDRTAVESLLFDAFIRAAYRDGAAGRWKAHEAERWLVFLARHLERTIGRPYFAWWQLEKAAPSAAFRLMAALVPALVAGLGAGLVAGLGALLGAGLPAGLAAGIGAGLGAMLLAWFVTGFTSTKVPARGMRISVERLTMGVAAGLAMVVIGPVAGVVIGLVIGLLTGHAAAGIEAGIAAGIAAGIVTGLGAGLMTGLEGVPGDLAEVVNPSTMLTRDRRTALRLVLVAALGALLLAVVGAGLVAGLAAGLKFGFAGGLVVGLAVGTILSMSETAWPPYMFAKGWLAVHRRLPWPLTDFLADAHRRGVLRQAGAVYQFRHIDLQHRLANRP